jgi:hypothetical protein
MSNLVIGLPTYIDNTTLNPLATLGTFDTKFPASNLLSGARSRLARLSVAASDCTITIDKGAASTLTIDFFYVARANILKSQGSKRVGLTASLDNVTYSNIAMNASGFQSVTLYGRESEDLIFTSELPGYVTGSLPDINSYRYYKVHFAGSGTCPTVKYAASKFMFGAWVDFGRDPESLQVIEQPTYSARSNYNLFKFTWRGIAKSVKDSAVASIIFNRAKGCILYTKDYHLPLLGRRVVHAMLDDYFIRYETEGFYTIELTFREQI